MVSQKEIQSRAEWELDPGHEDLMCLQCFQLRHVTQFAWDTGYWYPPAPMCEGCAREKGLL